MNFKKLKIQSRLFDNNRNLTFVISVFIIVSCLLKIQTFVHHKKDDYSHKMLIRNKIHGWISADQEVDEMIHRTSIFNFSVGKH